MDVDESPTRADGTVGRSSGKGSRSSFGAGESREDAGRTPIHGSSERRSATSSIRRWVTLTGDRRAIVGLLTLGVFVGLVGLGLAGIVDVSRAGRVSTVFSTTITGLFTLVTITVSINQLVLSRVLGSPGKIQDRIESVETFRDDVAEESVRVTVPPTEPAAFLEVIARALGAHARHLEDVFDEDRDPQVRGHVSEFVDELVALTEDVDEEVGSDRLRLIHVLLPILGNRYSAYVHTVDRIRATTDGLSATEERALAGLREVLVEINQTRHYFKTLYLHEALSSLSLIILLSGVGAVFVSYVVILSYAVPPGGAGALHLLVVSGALAVALVPLAVLFAYGARVATIASQTTTFGTFTPVEEHP